MYENKQTLEEAKAFASIYTELEKPVIEAIYVSTANPYDGVKREQIDY